MTHLTNVPFHCNDEKYEIRISFENGDFIFQVYLDGVLKSDTLRENALQAITGYMENEKPIFTEALTVIKDNITKGFNMR